MADFPSTPFLTEDFSPQGKGIDYLGMRNVNLIFLESQLIPGINNATRDLGTYVLGVWITWKFIELCGPSCMYKYTRDNFRKFSQAIEVAISHTTRDGSPVNAKHPIPRNRIGKNQKIDLSLPLTFENMGRGLSASIFYAAQYGPSLRWIGLTADARSEDGRSAGFQMVLDDEDTKAICGHVDNKLQQSPHYEKLLQGDRVHLTLEEIDELGTTGLCAGSYRRPHGALKKSLESKLFLPGNKRKITADLIIATLRKLGPLTEEDLRRVWYTGLTPSGEFFALEHQELQQQSRQWGIFYSRQILRYALESLLCCLERAVDRGCLSIKAVVNTLLLDWMEAVEGDSIETFADLLRHICRSAGINGDERLGLLWSQIINPHHENFEYIEFRDGAEMFADAMTMLAGWWMRLSGNAELAEQLEKLPDESGRVPMKELHSWLSDRMEDNFINTCKDLMADFIYSQHLRIGMSRLGEDGTRLRFSLGDHGISPTANLDNFAKADPPFMADRLLSLVNLMEDLGYVIRNGTHISAL